MAKLIKLTHETLTELLDYDPATGVFTWKVARSNRVKVGSRAGVFHKPTGGRYIGIGDEKFMAHRLAWFYVKGEMSKMDIRPIDGDYDNCAIDNLKEISRIELQHARGANKNNTTGFAGVSAAPHGKFQAKITWNNIQVSLGMNFATAEDAAGVVQKAQAELRKTTSQQEIEEVLESLRLQKRQRAVWANLLRGSDQFSWETFDDFSADVMDIPEHRYAMAPIDATKPIGADNYRWASDGHDISSSKDRIAYNKATREANRDHHRGRDFKKNYGIDFGEYQRMLIEQKGVCAICEQPETKLQHGSIRMLSVDHDHTTGAVRGLLCGNCNMAIGYACDDVSVLRKAIVYLESHKPADVIPFTPKVSEIDE
jgi:hypothetical protein